MHPFLARGRLGPYFAAWLPIGALLTALVRLAGAASWLEAAVLVAPLAVVYAFICLASWYPCRSLPLTAAQLPRTVLVHGGAGVVSTLVWLFVAATWSAALEALPAFAGLDQRFPRIAAMLAAAGLILYALAATLHCAVRAAGLAAEAEARALEQMLAAREAELSALKAQVSPHFLFNALNSIAGLAASEPETVRRTTVALADFLRASLRAARCRTITLAEELDLVEAYLGIEKIRFGARLTVARRVADAVLAVPVPPLILQPLVENAVVRGIAHLVEGGAVTIEAHADDAGLRLSVTNPYDPATAGRGGEGLGMANVRARLAAAYGPGGELVAHAAGGTFRAELRLPHADLQASEP
jgi:hypothetical protein